MPEAVSEPAEWVRAARALLRRSLGWNPALRGLCGRAGGGRGELQERQTLWRHSLSLRAAGEAATGVERAGGSPGVGRGPGGGSRGTEKSAGPWARSRAAWVSVPRRRRRRLPGGCGSPGGAGVRAASEGPKPPTPAWRPCPAGGRRWTQGRGRGLSTFPEPGVSAAAPGLPGFGRSEEPEPRGEGFQETKARAGGVGPRLWGLCADTCSSRLWVFVDLGPGTYICLRLCVSMALRGCFAPVSTFCGPAFGCGCWWAHGCVPAYVFCACRRVWVGCPWCVCAPRARHRPNSSLPCCPLRPPTWFQTFRPVPPAAARPSPLQPGQGVLATLPSFVSWGP